MYKKTFHTALAEARRVSGLSLRQLEAVGGLPARRLTRLERGIALPTPEERRALASVLRTHIFDILNLPVRPRRLYQTLKNRGRRLLPEQKPFYPPRDRPSRIRLYAAQSQYPREMKALRKSIHQHQSFEELNCLCEQLALDSSLECLFLSSLFAEGAEPLVLAPYSLPPRLPQQVICPLRKVDVGFRPFPCVKTHKRLYIPQVAFATPSTFVVDFLCHQDGKWSALEIDGRGHDDKRDREKERALGISVTRLDEGEVLKRVHTVLRRRGFAA